MKQYLLQSVLALVVFSFVAACRQTPANSHDAGIKLNALESYVAQRDMQAPWEVSDTIAGEDYNLYIVRMISQEWLSSKELKDPVWWHWLSIVVPDSIRSNTGMLFIGGGNRERAQPDKVGDQFIKTALMTRSVVAELHNVPNQPLEFRGDDFGPRVEDEIISLGWRKFLEGGARDEDIRWLARMPMTTAAVRAMDVLQAFSTSHPGKPLEKFVVAGASKRGWTTWTTGMVDDRVTAIIPIVIDMLNVIPSFEHHWRVYGKWAPAVGDYQREGIMEWQGSREYERLMSLTEPFSFRDKLSLPKLIINATGDQFFLPDSWKFYWDQLIGEKHLRYVPNSEHSMRETDAWSTLLAFYQMIVEETPRPDFNWRVQEGKIHIETDKKFAPDEITLWEASNPTARNFQVDSIGRAYTPTPIPITADGKYDISVEPPDAGWKAFFVELTFQEPEKVPLKLTTGVVIIPGTYPYAKFQSDHPMGTR